jgi:hypothetical protein
MAKGAAGQGGYAVVITLSRRDHDHVALLTSALPQGETLDSQQCGVAA